jgi:hypothetical protein
MPILYCRIKLLVAAGFSLRNLKVAATQIGSLGHYVYSHQ